MVSPRVLVQPPVFTPSRYGLLSVAQDMTAQADKHWEAGVIWQPLCAGPGNTYDPCLSVTGIGAAPATPPTKSATFGNVNRAANPFTVYVRKDCSAPTYWYDAPDQIAEAITEAEAWQVERTFWTGIAAGNKVVFPHLAANAQIVDNGDTLQLAATIVTATPQTISPGLGAIEQALGNCYQGVGVIHVPNILAPEMMSTWQLIPDGPYRYRTPSGNLVAIGRGYTGSAPDGTSAPGVAWIYATGAMFYLRSPIREFNQVQSFNRATNTLQQMAERTYVVGWDCCLLAMPVQTVDV